MASLPPFTLRFFYEHNSAINAAVRQGKKTVLTRYLKKYVAEQ